MEKNLIMKENMIVIRDPKTFCFNFDLPKNIDEILMFETEAMKIY